MKTKLLVVLVLFAFGISPVFASEPETITLNHYQPEVELLPEKKVQYGESFTIHAWLSTYENRPENLGFFVDVLDSENNQVDSTLWFARDDFVYEFDTTHPAYNITKSGNYFIKIEKADQMQRTGIFYKTLEFEIDYINKHPSPLKQFKSGVPLHEIQCNDGRILIHQKDTLKPACVFHDSELIFDRKWAKMRIGMPAEVITTEKLCFWYSDEMPKYLAPYCELKPPFEEDVFIELVKNAVFDKEGGHYDYLPINNNPNMMVMETIQLRDDDSIKIRFGQNNYEWSTGYKPIPYFEYVASFKVNDTFVVLCTNVGKDGYAEFHPEISEPFHPTLGVVKYLGPITIENEPILLFWHESASLQDDISCSYPEMIHHSVNLWQLQEHGLPTDSLENALGSNTMGIAPVEPIRTPPPEPPFEKKEPLTKIELMFGEKQVGGLLPVIVTEVTTHAETLDEITVWNFELIGHSGDDRRLVWETLPKDKRIWYEITDDDGQDAIDHTRMPEAYAIPDDQHIYEMDCGFFQIVEGESAHPSSFPIKNNTSSIFAKNSWMGLYPDFDGKYSFEFASIFEHTVKFPDDTYDFLEIISQETKECNAKWQIDGNSEEEEGKGYYTKMTFRFLENEN